MAFLAAAFRPRSLTVPPNYDTVSVSVRSITHLGVVVILLLSFAQAPFQHAHASDPSHAHAKGFVHAHWSNSSAQSPTWEADDHDSDARAIDWLAGDGSAPVKFVVDLPESITQPVLTIQVAHVPALKLPEYDPPWRLNLNPRAPPA